MHLKNRLHLRGLRQGPHLYDATSKSEPKAATPKATTTSGQRFGGQDGAKDPANASGDDGTPTRIYRKGHESFYQSLTVLRRDDRAREAHWTCPGQDPVQRDPLFMKSAGTQRKETKEICTAPTPSHVTAISTDPVTSDRSARSALKTTYTLGEGVRMLDEPDYPVGENEFSRLCRLEEAGFAETGKIPTLDALCAEAKAQFGTEMVAVTLLTKDVQILKARVGIDVDETPRNIAFCNQTILDDAVLVVLDTHEDPRFSHSPVTLGEPFLRFYAGAPLVYLADVRLGAFCIFAREPRESFTQGERAELVDFSERAVHILVEQLGRFT